MNPKMADLLERAVWTGVQAGAAVVVYDVMHPELGLDWRALLIAAAAAAGLSIAKTLGINASLAALLAQLSGTPTGVQAAPGTAAQIETAGATPAVLPAARHAARSDW